MLLPAPVALRSPRIADSHRRPVLPFSRLHPCGSWPAASLGSLAALLTAVPQSRALLLPPFRHPSTQCPPGPESPPGPKPCECSLEADCASLRFATAEGRPGTSGQLSPSRVELPCSFQTCGSAGAHHRARLVGQSERQGPILPAHIGRVSIARHAPAPRY